MSLRNHIQITMRRRDSINKPRSPPLRPSGQTAHATRTPIGSSTIFESLYRKRAASLLGYIYPGAPALAGYRLETFCDRLQEQ